ncbi:hypothetical protein ACQP04_28935 [Pseudonocardia halophobica]|uniref:hypothetical protein n=1 Tax=Pseudonocardia halophobica TaxID=29401 RepID=UPI003D92F918
MELRGVPRQLGTHGGLISAHRLRLRDDVEVQRAPDRLGERADPADLRDEVLVERAHHLLKDTSIDLRISTV